LLIWLGHIQLFSVGHRQSWNFIHWHAHPRC
jgi:hypothetical protein